MLVFFLHEDINRRAWPHANVCYRKLVGMFWVLFWFLCVETFIPLSKLHES